MPQALVSKAETSSKRHVVGAWCWQPFIVRKALANSCVVFKVANRPWFLNTSCWMRNADETLAEYLSYDYKSKYVAYIHTWSHLDCALHNLGIHMLTSYTFHCKYCTIVLGLKSSKTSRSKTCRDLCVDCTIGVNLYAHTHTHNHAHSHTCIHVDIPTQQILNCLDIVVIHSPHQNGDTIYQLVPMFAFHRPALTYQILLLRMLNQLLLCAISKR